MDRHLAPGVTMRDAIAIHELDLAVEAKHGCRCLTFWVDEARGLVNCLVEAPEKDALVAMHMESTGQPTAEILEVHPDLVMAFLGRLDDLPSTSAAPVDSSMRTVMFTDLKDSTAMTTRLGDTAAMEHLRIHDEIVRRALAQHRGREVKHTGDGFMTSFAFAPDAVACAIALQREFAAYNARRPAVELHVRVGLSAGEPVVQNNDLFGRTVQLAARICAHAQPGEVIAHESVRDLSAGISFVDKGHALFKGFEKPERIFAVVT
jgi:class 3 adenylate cyclase